MTKQSIEKEYFEWMCSIVYDKNIFKLKTYNRLLIYLHIKDFTYSMEMDGNRAGDGINLRYRFGYEADIDERIIATFLDNRPCSVLEMMVALSMRCEESIMDNPDIGNRTGKWFYDMLSNLGLLSMIDAKFDERYVDFVLERFLNREYEKDGYGGLFTVHDFKYDLRTVEIWCQMMWYLDEVIKEKT